MQKLFLLLIVSLFCSLSSSAGIRTVFESIPDSVLANKERAVIVRDTMDYLSADISSALSIEMKAMKMENGDSCICLVKTYKAPAEHSTLVVYDMQWNVLARQTFSLEDVLGTAAYPVAKMLLDPVLVSVRLSQDNDSITLRLSDFMLSEEEKKELKDVSLTKVIKWCGKDFR